MRRFFIMTFSCVCVVSFLYGNEIIIIGKLGEAGELISPRMIKEGPDGNIYAYDQVDAFIKVYSHQGKYLRKMGGEGQGPGEIQRRDGVSLGFTSDGKLFFTEYFAGHPWITLMELSGKLHSVIKPDIREFFGISLAYSLPDGGFLIQYDFSDIPKREKDYFYFQSPREIIRQDAQGGVISKIKRTQHISRISYESRGADSPIPFVPGFAWCPFQDNKILFSEGLSTELEVYDYAGKLVKKIPTSLPEPVKVSGKDMERWRLGRKEMMLARNPDWYNRFGKVIENYKKSLHGKKPNLRRIAVTPAGNILASEPWDEQGEVLDYWLLDEGGKILSKISTTANYIRISKSFIFFRTTDEDMNITSHALRRTGKEREDILKIRGK